VKEYVSKEIKLIHFQTPNILT